MVDLWGFHDTTTENLAPWCGYKRWQSYSVDEIGHSCTTSIKELLLLLLSLRINVDVETFVHMPDCHNKPITKKCYPMLVTIAVICFDAVTSQCWCSCYFWFISSKGGHFDADRKSVV